ncbi:bifunctional glutamate N-acetyltransferase/amino-acid acetyltransferase ArgJ [Litoribrevibacter albus]|uniref:Arginine biosynthesis bifunctional protein ArgJ n=1 Tax=Litoribrevibacter albus TaxID=1473156 RepID=A0AA37SD42_9GAMM|nr:bifunctional glutamate N-acetyltransferase/amino-acid acetyltransferase ArgJ [Litoribrevibacter albus]GLQ33264.1 arginine biosynthesis bifunctional protein ArgJ [Litoribrevibacter albus]
MATGNPTLPNLLPIDGVKIAIVSAGIKKPGRRDLVVFELAEGSCVAGVFTKNRFCAAPVLVSKEHLSKGSPRYLIVNTGNANAGTGEQGLRDAKATCDAVAQCYGVSASEVLPFSTGVIGENLPMDRLLSAIPTTKDALVADAWVDAASGIMTTDTRPKGASVSFEYQGHSITLTGISKGAGMIKPNMATMLGYVATDLAMDQEILQALLTETATKSFNRITVDSDTSTNDSCVLVATGKSSAPAITSEQDELYGLFKEKLQTLMITLAQAIIRDGEGATKFVTIQVENALSQDEALEVAFTVAHSPLVKTALFASDPNWGRILAAVGRANISEFDLNKLEIYLDDVCIVRDGGRATDYTEEAGQAVMNQEDILIRINMASGDASETVWTSDLSHDYVTINAEYRT